MGWERGKAALKGLLHLDDEPHKIAMGFAVGTFISFSPLYGTHLIMTLALAFLFRLNKAAAIIGAWVVLPWFAPFTLGFGYFLGRFLMGQGLGLPQMGPWGMEWVWRNILPLLLGCSLEGAAAAVCAYFLVRQAVEGWRNARPSEG